MDEEFMPYRDACTKHPSDYYDYEHYEPKWGSSEIFEVLRSLNYLKSYEI